MGTNTQRVRIFGTKTKLTVVIANKTHFQLMQPSEKVIQVSTNAHTHTHRNTNDRKDVEMLIPFVA